MEIDLVGPSIRFQGAVGSGAELWETRERVPAPRRDG